MTQIDRRTFLRGILYGVLARILGWEITEATKAEAAPGEEAWGIDYATGSDRTVTIATYPSDGHWKIYIAPDENGAWVYGGNLRPVSPRGVRSASLRDAIARTMGEQDDE